VNPDQLIDRIELLGGHLALNGERLRYELPADAAPLLNDLRNHREGVVAVLRARPAIPRMPNGVRLISWAPKGPPILLTRWAVVINTTAFIENTLQELDAALAGKNWLAGNWSVRELVERLEQVGVSVSLSSQSGRSE
jgi:hypothetical protein